MKDLAVHALASLALWVASSTELTPAQQRRLTPVVEVVRSEGKSVVSISATQRVTQSSSLFDVFALPREVQRASIGSGSVIHRSGYVLTNAHVVALATELNVTLASGQELPAHVVAALPDDDIAILKVDLPAGLTLPAVRLGTSSDVLVGETVVAIGNPYGQTYTVSTGIISGLHRNIQIPQENLEFDDLIQTDAGINPGNSGGPLLNINGELIGINNAMNSVAENIGFAIPVDRVRKVLEEQLLAPESSDTWLGFEVKFSDHAQVKSVVPGSPANIAGLQPGDCIVSIGGKGVAKPDEYAFARAAVSAQKEVEIVVERDGGKRQLKVEPWNRVDGQLYERIGVRLRDVEGRSNRWIEVREVRGGSPAAKLGLKAGDVVRHAIFRNAVP